MNISEVSMAAEKKAVERDKGKKDNGKTDIAATAGILAAGGMGMGFEAAGGRCGSSEQAICGTLFCS
jgi:hypothetical protein